MFCDNNICMCFDPSTKVPSLGACAIIAHFAELLFEFCFDCDFNKFLANMPGVPQGAFAACKVRERNMKVAKVQMMDQETEKIIYHGKHLELSPVKYNSKLMNSIWGLYNRYSVHNFKKITDAANVVPITGSQQLSGLPVAADKNSAGIKGTKSSPVLVSDWINIWGTHKY